MLFHSFPTVVRGKGLPTLSTAAIIALTCAVLSCTPESNPDSTIPGTAVQDAKASLVPIVMVPMREGGTQPLGEVSNAYALGSDYLVLDHSLGRVMVFDSAGSLRHSIGRVGSGPGEFRMLLDASSSANGQRFAVFDPQNVSITIARLHDDSVRLTRFPVRPSIGAIHYTGDDTLLAFTPFGRVNGEDTVFFLYSERGNQVGAFGRLAKWSDGVSPGISELLIDVNANQYVAAEGFGSRLAWYHHLLDQPIWETVIYDGTPTSLRMDSAVHRGLAPQKTLQLGFIQGGVWIVGRDSALVRQDTLLPSGGRLHRYALITRGERRFSELSALKVVDLVGATAIIARQDDDGVLSDGVLSLGRMPWQRVFERGETSRRSP